MPPDDCRYNMTQGLMTPLYAAVYLAIGEETAQHLTPREPPAVPAGDRIGAAPAG